jgi:hypothetical protein
MSSETESRFAATGNPGHANLQGNPHPTAQTRRRSTTLPARLTRQINNFVVLHGRPMIVLDVGIVGVFTPDRVADRTLR